MIHKILVDKQILIFRCKRCQETMWCEPSDIFSEFGPFEDNIIIVKGQCPVCGEHMVMADVRKDLKNTEDFFFGKALVDIYPGRSNNYG